MPHALFSPPLCQQLCTYENLLLFLAQLHIRNQQLLNNHVLSCVLYVRIRVSFST